MLSRSTADAPASTASDTCSGRSHSTSTIRPGHDRLAAATASVIPSRPRWLSFTSTASDNPARWFQPPPGPHGRLLEHPEARRRLSRVEHPGGGVRGGDGVDEPARHGGDARQVTEEIERGPLGGEDRPHRARHLGHHRSRHQPARRRGSASPPRAAPSICENASSAHSRPASTPSARATTRTRPTSFSGTSRAVRSPSGPMSSEIAPATAARTASMGGSAGPEDGHTPVKASVPKSVSVSRGVMTGPRVRGEGSRRGHGPVDETTPPLRTGLGEVPPGVCTPGLLTHIGGPQQRP